MVETQIASAMATVDENAIATNAKLDDIAHRMAALSNWMEAMSTTTTDLKNTGMVVVIDIGDPHNVHPKNKQEVSRRLALQAKANVYDMDVVCDGPIYMSMTVEVSAIRLHFKSLGVGLAARGGGPLKGFVIAGADRKFVPAEAVVDGDSILVRSESIVSPVAMRYAWEMNPDCNLINRADLPASPFRTDAWPFWQGVHDQQSAEDGG